MPEATTHICKASEDEAQENLEEAIIGLLLLQNKDYKLQYEIVFNNLKKEMFRNGVLAEIFEECQKLHSQKKEIDPLIIAKNLEHIPNITGKIGILGANAELSCNLIERAKTIFESYINYLSKNAKNYKEFEKIKKLKESTFIEEKRVRHVSEINESITEKIKHKEKNMLSTLYGSLDNIIGSFGGSDLIYLGGATGMCKTSFAINLARNICMQEKTVLYFSLEMPFEQLHNRIVCINEELKANKIRTMDFNLIELQKYKQGELNLKQWNIYISDEAKLTPESMLKIIENKQKETKIDFVIIDYLGLMSGYANKNNYERLSTLSREIKTIALHLKIPFLCLVQLNRDLKTRENKRPVMSDIKDSSQIEQDADMVLFVHRESVFEPDKANKYELEIIIAKNRHGQTGQANLIFDYETQRIFDPMQIDEKQRKKYNYPA